MELRGARAVITGGSSGIGRAVALDLADAGAEAIAVNYAHREEEALETCREIEARGARALAVRADAGVAADVERMVGEAVEALGGLSVLVTSAGYTQLVPFDDLDAIGEEMWDRVMDVNLKGPFLCSRSAASELRRSRGAIVNVSSVAGMRATGSSIPYGVSKAGLIQLTRALALALAPDVRVNAVAPGIVASDWITRLVDDAGAQDIYETARSKTPQDRTLEPPDVSQVVLSLLRADGVTGETVVVDGGRAIDY
jgi:NAD(P)-dependent dehydrogenase (short-subunit alcohol dehydrogenase family)